MREELENIQRQAGAIFSEDLITPMSFANEKQVLELVKSGVALCDRSHWGLLQISGADRVRYLHNQSTNNFNIIKAGQGCDTVFVTSTARTIDLATAYLTEDSILVLVSPQRRQKLMEWLDRFIFPMDRVELTDLSSTYAIFSLIGTESDIILENLGLAEIIGQADGDHQLLTLENISLRVAVGNGLKIPGYNLILPLEKAAKIWSILTSAGAIPMGNNSWEQLRILQGRPAPDRELTEDYNPLEAGLLDCISWEKGCYIGQETIARLNTYKGVKQRLWGVELSAPVIVGSLITLEQEKIGVITSYTETAKGSFALAYVRTKAGGAGLKVQVKEVEGKLVALPFTTHN